MGFLVNQALRRPILFIFTTLTTQNLCSISIEKRGVTVVTYFWVPTQKRRKYKKKNYKKNITVKKESQNAQKIVKIG
jgi:hypothetical protein